MEIDSLFPSKYLRGSDLQGHAVSCQIERVIVEKFFNQENRNEEEKLVVFFSGKSKGLILGKSMAYTFAEICHSKNTDTWPSHEVILYSEKRLVYGVEKDVIRVRAKAEAENATGF